MVNKFTFSYYELDSLRRNLTFGANKDFTTTLLGRLVAYEEQAKSGHLSATQVAFLQFTLGKMQTFARKKSWKLHTFKNGERGNLRSIVRVTETCKKELRKIKTDIDIVPVEKTIDSLMDSITKGGENSNEQKQLLKDKEFFSFFYDSLFRKYKFDRCAALFQAQAFKELSENERIRILANIFPEQVINEHIAKQVLVLKDEAFTEFVRILINNGKQNAILNLILHHIQTSKDFEQLIDLLRKCAKFGLEKILSKEEQRHIVQKALKLSEKRSEVIKILLNFGFTLITREIEELATKHQIHFARYYMAKPIEVSQLDCEIEFEKGAKLQVSKNAINKLFKDSNFIKRILESDCSELKDISDKEEAKLTSLKHFKIENIPLEKMIPACLERLTIDVIRVLTEIYSGNTEMIGLVNSEPDLYKKIIGYLNLHAFFWKDGMYEFTRRPY